MVMRKADFTFAEATTIFLYPKEALVEVAAILALGRIALAPHNMFEDHGYPQHSTAGYVGHFN